MTNQFFTTPQERESFFRRLHTGELGLPPGCWFRHAVNSPEMLGEMLYDDRMVLLDCSMLAVVEIEGIIGKRLDRIKLMNMPMFGYLVGTMRAKGLEGLRNALVRLATEYDPVSGSDVQKHEVPEPSPEAIQQWARMFAAWAEKFVAPEDAVHTPSPAMLERGMTAAKALGIVPTDHALTVIWKAMTAAKE